MAVESPVQKRMNVTIARDEVFRKFMNWNRWHRVNPRIVRAFLNKSGDTIRWLEEKGVEFELASERSPDGPPTVHIPTDMMASVQKALIKSAKDLGVNTLLHTSGKRIIRGAKGNITGVLAQTRDGQEFDIKTKSAIIATGGFGANRELLKKYCPDYYNEMHLWEWPPHFSAHSGDGMYMAEEIGADMADWVPIYHRAGPDFGGYPWKPALPFSMTQRMIWVNKKGKRFADEVGAAGMYAGNALFLQPDQVAYALFGDDLRLITEAEASRPGPEVKPQKHAKLGGGAILASVQFSAAGLKEKLRELAVKRGMKIADSWEAMASWMGVDPEALKAEIDEYNSFCDKGHDEIFAKDPQYLVPLRTPPYYAIRIYGDAGETLGGIKVDEHMAVLDKRGDVIPGVYAAGVIADGHQGQTYNHDDLSGAAVGFAVNSGRIAGENASGYIKASGR
jgi:fumarate reductase flavoprotein subunit